MNAHTNALRGYAQSANPTRTPRAAEYSIIAQVTHRMRQAAMRGKPGFKDLAGAIYDNRRLWTALAVDVADEKNPLPAELRARVIFLSEFTNAHSRKVLNREANVVPLLQINAAILKGLSQESVGQ